MLRTALLFSFMCYSFLYGHTQNRYGEFETDLAPIRKNVGVTLRLIQQNKLQQLADRVVYPLKRPNPLPDIKNKTEFLNYYHLLLDTSTKKMAGNADINRLFELHNKYSIDDWRGMIWFDEKGNICQVNYSSPAEQRLKAQLTEKIKKKMYPGLNNWDENILVWRSSKWMVRVDKLGDNYRYIAWGRGKTIADKPDLVLNDGLIEPFGTQGGVGYRFRNGIFTYELDDCRLGYSDDNVGTFLNIRKNGTRIVSYTCEETK